MAHSTNNKIGQSYKISPSKFVLMKIVVFKKVKTGHTKNIGFMDNVEYKIL